MPKLKYRFNTDKLIFEKIDRKKRRVRVFFMRSIIIVLLAITINYLYYIYGTTIKENYLKKSNLCIIDDCKQIRQRVAEIDAELQLFQTRDDKIYRPYTELNPIPKSIREVGFGGIDYYINLQGLNHSELLINTTQSLDIVSRKLKVQSKSLEEIIKTAALKYEKLECLPAIRPLSPKDFRRVSDYFGTRIDPFLRRRLPHYGIDLVAPRKSNVYCSARGTISKAEYVRGYGKLVEVDHGFGFKTRYAHLDNINVKVNQKVVRGDIIGLLGNTGRSTGPHLHYEVRINNRPVNPRNYYFENLTEEEFGIMIEKFKEIN